MESIDRFIENNAQAAFTQGRNNTLYINLKTSSIQNFSRRSVVVLAVQSMN